jgi:cytidylate kinase
MRIYFVGAHGTGKTTLARYVSEKYNIPMITEVARMVLSEKEYQLDALRHNLDLVDDYQLTVYYRQMLEETKFDSFVSDRSFDCLAYAAQHTRILPTILKESGLAYYIDRLKQQKSPIFFVRPSKATLKADGVRETLNWDGVVAIDAMCKFMLEMWELKYFSINMDNMQERVRLVDNVLC